MGVLCIMPCIWVAEFVVTFFPLSDSCLCHCTDGLRWGVRLGPVHAPLSSTPLQAHSHTQTHVTSQHTKTHTHTEEHRDVATDCS